MSNAGNSLANQVTVEYFNNNGQKIGDQTETIAANRQTSFMKGPAAAANGWARISSSSSLYGMALIFGLGDTPMFDVDVASQLSNQLTIPHMDSSGAWKSSAMLCNPNASSAQVTMTFYPKDASLSPSTQSLNIPAMGSVQHDLAAFSPSGTVQIDSTQPLAGFLLYDGRASGYKWLGGLSIVPTQPGCVAAGLLQGSVMDSAHAPVPNVTLTIRDSSGAVAATTQTDAGGNFSVSLAAGSYSITFSRTGYLSTVYHGVSVAANETTYLETTLLIAQSQTGYGGISGYVTNSVTGELVPGVTLSLRSGIHAATGSIIATASTDSSGFYNFTNIQAGVYTAETFKAGFIPSFFTVYALANQTVINQNESITPESMGTEGVIRVNLTWGENPRDLDSHMTGPLATGGRFHVYYSDEESSDGKVTLDTDDTDSYGPENITISEQLSGVYQYGVHDFTNRSTPTSSAMGQSGAKVRVYDGDALIMQFNVPNQPGIFWNVFQLQNGVITPINTMNESINISRSTWDGTGLLEDISLDDLPEKY